MITVDGIEPSVLPLLFVATFKDGSEYRQTEEDRSIDPEHPTKDCWFDVLQRIEDLAYFRLQRRDETEYWLVDAEDGHFEHSGQVFFIHDPARDQFSKFRVYYKRVWQDQIEVGTNGGRTKAHNLVAFRLGWTSHGNTKSIVIPV